MRRLHFGWDNKVFIESFIVFFSNARDQIIFTLCNKNVGLQKKVRSDVINAINDKYIFINQGENNLIASVRKEDDKRFYEYFVVPTEVKTVQKLIEKN